MISALVAALLAAHAALIGTLGETAIFNCQLGSNIRMISALVAALLASFVDFVGTVDTTIFNCQLGGHVSLNSVLRLSGGFRARLSAYCSLGIIAARDTVALFTSPSRNAVAPMSTTIQNYFSARSKSDPLLLHCRLDR